MSLDTPGSERRRCPIDSTLFTPSRSTNLYCTPRCRKRAYRLRATPGKVHTRRVVDVEELLSNAAEKHRVTHGKEVVRAAYLDSYAAVVEAELQVNIWQDRLAKRRAALRDLSDPEMSVKRLVLHPGEPVTFPPLADAFGGCSTDGSLAVVCVGVFQRHPL